MTWFDGSEFGDGGGGEPTFGPRFEWVWLVLFVCLVAGLMVILT